jgi:hypothetical protein
VQPYTVAPERVAELEAAAAIQPGWEERRDNEAGMYTLNAVAP